MIGYSKGNKAYRVYDPIGKRVLIRRDVIFNEFPQPHLVTEITMPKEGQLQCPENKQSLKNDEMLTEPMKTDKEPSTNEHRYRNPRLPIPRDPYSKRTTSKSTPDDTEIERTAIAETFMVSTNPINIEEAVEAEDSSK